VLSALGKQFQSQALVHDKDKSYDKMTCADGTELWFDITEMLGKMTARLNAGGK
jgi:hypothetical protein